MGRLSNLQAFWQRLLEMLYQLRKMHSLLRISVYSELLIPLYQTPSQRFLQTIQDFLLKVLCWTPPDVSHRWESAQVMTSMVVHPWLPRGTTERHAVLYHQGCLTTTHLRDASGL